MFWRSFLLSNTHSYRIKCIFTFLGFISLASFSHAEIVVDSNSNTPSLSKGSKGTTLINISKPTQSGVSVNNFKSYDVLSSGVLINNATKKASSSSGEQISSNPNFSKNKSASLIIFNVTGTEKSNLKGVQETVGNKADFILSNPNGVSINGGSFKNNSRVTLTTGKTSVSGQKITLGVEKGTIEVMGKGIKNKDIDQLDLIAQHIQLQSKVEVGEKLNLISGHNQVSYKNNTIIKTDTSAKSSKKYAIDANALGSMYAGKIYIISTEKGVGVRTLGKVVAQKNNIIIKANGDIYYKSLESKKKNKIESTGGKVNPKKSKSSNKKSSSKSNQTSKGNSSTNGNSISGVFGNQGNDKDVGNGGGQKSNKGKAKSENNTSESNENESASSNEQASKGNSSTNENKVSDISGNQGNDKKSGNAGVQQKASKHVNKDQFNEKTYQQKTDESTGDGSNSFEDEVPSVSENESQPNEINKIESKHTYILVDRNDIRFFKKRLMVMNHRLQRQYQVSQYFLDHELKRKYPVKSIRGP